MPTPIHHLCEMPRLSLHVEGDVCRIVMDAPYSADSESTRTNAELRKAWIKEHCAGSAVPNIYWNPVIKQEVMDVRFSPEDLALYQRTFEQADGRSAVPGEHCLLMRHADYVADVRRLANARWGTDQPALVKFPRLSYKLGDETLLENQKAHWQLLCRLRHISAQWTQPADLTTEEIQTLAQLNARLMQVEQWCVDEVATIHRQNGPKATPPLFPTGYFRLTDVWVEVAFCLKEGDPEYDDGDDNYFWQLDRPVHGMQFDRARRWNEPPEENNQVSNSNGPQGGYLFDKLRQHLGLDWRDMLRVGDVHVDVRYRGTRVSPSLSTSDSVAYAPVHPCLWRDEYRRPLIHRYHLSGLRNAVGLDPLDDDVAVDSWTGDLSADEMAHCERMNAELESVTFHIEGTTRAIGTPLEKRVADPQDALDDYLMEAFNDYWLHPHDAVALARGDRLLVRQDYSICKSTEDHVYFDHETDWAESVIRDQFAFRHCYAFHALSKYHHISLKDVPRIDRVCTKVEVWLQRFFREATSANGDKLTIPSQSTEELVEPLTAGDTLLNRARQLVITHQEPTVGFLQRHLQIGYSAALALMQKLEGDIVSAPDETGWRRMLETGAFSRDDPRSNPRWILGPDGIYRRIECP